ncbi:MAG: hypothetical protein AAF991_08370 [Pseudomonadota bacterium]
MATERDDGEATGPTGWKSWAWLVTLWFAGVASVTVVGLLIRTVLGS